MPGKKESFSPPALGGSSLLVVFAVLALTVFALLSLSTVRAGNRLSQAAGQAVQDYYAADCQAQEILARLRQGERPEGVIFTEGCASYVCPISETQELQVRVRMKGAAGYVIEQWQVALVGNWEFDDNLIVWDGQS